MFYFFNDYTAREKKDFMVARMTKNLPAVQETCIQPLGQEDPLQKEMATLQYSSALQYSCLENSMNRGAWSTVVRGITKSQTQLSD